MDCGLSSFFFKDGGGPRGPKKRGMHPPFLFFLWIAGVKQHSLAERDGSGFQFLKNGSGGSGSALAVGGNLRWEVFLPSKRLL